MFEVVGGVCHEPSDLRRLHTEKDCHIVKHCAIARLRNDGENKENANNTH